MHKGKIGFTIIELIVVSLIITILVTMSIPRIFDNLKKSRKASVVTYLDTIRGAMLAYNAAFLNLPAVTGGTPILVTIDGEQTMNVAVPVDYTFSDPVLYAPETYGCSYTMNIGTGVVSGTAGCP